MTADASVKTAPQPFETEHLGGPSYRMTMDRGADRAAIERCLAPLVGQARLVHCRIPADWTAEAEALAEAGFREMETLVTLERDVPAQGGIPAGCGLAEAADEAPCLAIAADAFTFDRFHVDQRIPASAADAIKVAWVRNGLRGRADAPLVARDPAGRAVGFNLCLLANETAVIDLIAVAPAHAGHGYGRKLVEAALAHYAGRARRLRVGTQATNAASLGLYHATGFAETARARTFHWMDTQ